MIPWASVIGTGIAGALIAYPLMYYALSNHYKAKLSNTANLCLYIVTVPLVGIADLVLGTDSQTLSGFLALVGAPLLVTFIVIGAAFESRAERAKVEAEGRNTRASAKSLLRRFTRPAERAALIAMLCGVALLFAGLVGYWSYRGFYWGELKYNFQEIFFGDIRYGRGWSQWSARIGLAVVAVGYAVSFHYESTVTPFVRWTSAFARWIRTGE